ncbi:hypothetical protein D3C79_1067970 [compost metagenome]
MLIGMRPEIRALNRTLHTANTGYQRHVNSARDESVPKIRHVIVGSFIIVEISVFVLHLNENDVPSP